VVLSARSNKSHSRSLRSGAAVIMASILGMTITAAMAQGFPTRPVRLVVPTAPGGNADIVARLTSEAMAKDLGQPIVVDNRPGGRQIPGSYLVARAAPDGYTLLAIGLAFTINAGLYSDLPYDTLKDFKGVGLVGSVPLVLVATPSLPANNMKELIALAKAKPGTLNYASAGVGSPAHLGGELLKTLAGINLVHVAYKATAQGNIETMSGAVQLALPAMSSIVKLVKAGKLKALGIGSPKRSPLMPDVAPIADTVPGYDVQLFNGMLAPAATPRPIVMRLNVAMVKALNTPETRDKLVGAGLNLQPGTAEQFDTYLEAEINKWAQVVRQAGIKSQR